METSENLLNLISARYNELSKGQKRLAKYIVEHYDKAVFMTAAKLGKESGVSESTTVRFAMQLGFEGFPEFHHALEELVRNKLNSIQRMKVTYGDVPQAEILDRVLHSDIEKIKLTEEKIDHEAFNSAVDTLLSAHHIYVIGLRSSAPLAQFLTFYLNYIFDNITLVQTNNTSDIFEQMVRIREEDVVIGISFPRYSQRTMRALEFATRRKAKVITLTDSKHAPINNYSSCVLTARSDMASIVDSLVAPLSVINALIVALSMKKEVEVVHTLEDLEHIWAEFQVYNNEDISSSILHPELKEDLQEESSK